jgi:hypothetical protein
MKCEEVRILEFTNEDDCDFLQVGVVGYSGSIRGIMKPMAFENPVRTILKLTRNRVGKNFDPSVLHEGGVLIV